LKDNDLIYGGIRKSILETNGKCQEHQGSEVMVAEVAFTSYSK
jgi:hypothetical protein